MDKYKDHKYGKTNRKPIDMEKFYNPYSFVPLTNRVYCLSNEEKQKLSLDIPFKEGLSGTVIIDFESMTPFCVCEGKSGVVDSNANIMDKPFIPATSIKGMIRNVFEIVTMSNIKNRVANNRYSMRDVNSPSYDLKSSKEQKSGFLIKLNEKFFIHECKNEVKTYKEIEDEECIDEEKIKDFEHGSVEKKYGILEDYIVWYEDESCSMWFFSGFMNNKKHEYLFDIPQNFNNLIPLREEEYNEFIFIHENENENESWKFWKKKLKNYTSIEELKDDEYRGMVPCFFRTKEDRLGETCVRDLGFAYLYRVPYKKSIHDFIPKEYKLDESKIDMAQSVFGYVKDSEESSRRLQEALRGRLQFEHSFIDSLNPHAQQSKQTFILGGPKPTYYPFYLRQDNPGTLNNYFSENAQISGYKRYLVHKEADKGTISESNHTKTFLPLPANAKFSTKIHFHNLRGYELGALIAAITFCQKQESCYHSLGIAKSYGYGKIKVKDYRVELSGENRSQKDFYKEFIDKICKELKYNSEVEYLNSISPLFKIASGNYNLSFTIRYPDLKKEFKTIKNQKKTIKDFSPQN